MNRRIKAKLAALTIAFTAACSSLGSKPEPMQLVEGSGFKRAAYSNASGSACGVYLLDVLPIGVFSRMDRAYHSAVSNAGARALLKPTVSDHRIDLMVATLKCASVTGTAVY